MNQNQSPINRKRLGKLLGNLLDIDATLRFTEVQSGYVLPEKGSVVEALKKTFLNHSLEWEVNAFPSHSVANQLSPAGVKPIIFGCGELAKAHSPEESVSFNQVLKAAEIYYRLALQIL